MSGACGLSLRSDLQVTTEDYLMRWTPGGSQTGSKAPGKAGPLGGGYPAVLDRGLGPYVYDERANAYLDFICSLAAVGLEHAHPLVIGAVIEQLDKGNLLSLPTRLEGTASEMLCGITGWAQQARWVKTGSEATEAAVRIARCATGRDSILTVREGYHAWHSWFQAVKPQHPGVPHVMSSLIDWMPYGASGEALPGQSCRDFAAVILEPSPITGGGDAEWLAQLRSWCNATGTLLIFDEIVWGFRLSMSGGTGFYGVKPDLACYGKALGNGIPVAAVVGSTDLMKHASVVSGTFGGDRIGLGAAVAVMGIYQREGVIESLWLAGEALQAAFNGCTWALGLPIRMGGLPPHPIVTVDHDGRVEIMSLLLQELAAHGVLFHPAGLNVMQAHTPEIIKRVTPAFSAALAEVESALCGGVEEVRRRLKGEPYQQAFARRS